MLFVIIGIIASLLCFFLYEAIKKNKIEREVEEANNKRIEEEKRKEKRIKEEAKQLAKKEKYGERTDYLNLLGFSVSVYNRSKTIIINGKNFSFDEIEGCTIREEKTIIPGHTTTSYTTKTNSGSMIGRALVGAVVAGPIGAAIGGATAKKETIQHTNSTPDTVKYKYYVTIGVNRKGWQDIVYDTNFKDRAEKVVNFIEKIKKLYG